MVSPNFLEVRPTYLPFTVVVLVIAPLIWAQPSYDGILPSLTKFVPPDTTNTGSVFSSPSPTSSPLPPPQFLRLRPRDGSIASVDGYTYNGCVVDNANKRVLGAIRVDYSALSPTLCRNV